MTQEFKSNGETIVLTLDLVNVENNYTHFFTVTFQDGESDEVAISINRHNNLSEWLLDNCDIEPTEENIELFKKMLA